jgi:hypothetical protein
MFIPSARKSAKVASGRTVDVLECYPRGLPNDCVLLVAADSVDLAVIALAHLPAGDCREGRCD